VHPKWLIALGMAFFICSLIGGVLEMGYLGQHETTTLWQAMTAFDSIDSLNPYNILTGIAVGTYNLMKTVKDIILWDYSYFIGYWLIVRYLFMTISLGVVVALFLSLRGTSSA